MCRVVKQSLEPVLFFFNEPATPKIYPLSLHDALPISPNVPSDLELIPHLMSFLKSNGTIFSNTHTPLRSEEHTSELQSPCNLVCRLLLEKKTTTRSCRDPR